MRLHPATQILIWCVLVAAMQFLSPVRLLIFGALMLAMVFALSRHKFLLLMRRTRWILCSLWLIYAYTTPGESLSDSMGVFSPSMEGMQDGGLQLMRLLVALAGLAILLDRLHRQQLMAGLYSLFAPLKWLGLSRERLAVRLALTLHYAEVAMLRRLSLQESLHSLVSGHASVQADGVVELPVYSFARLDVIILSVVMMLLWLAAQ
jgi:energy-coupling factor transport system permease protein